MSAFEIEKDNIIRDFFDIGSNPDIEVKIVAIKEHKHKLNKLLKIQDDLEIRYLINVIDSLLIAMIESDYKKASKEVEHIWDILNDKANLSLYDIRILTCILFTANSVDEFLATVDRCLYNLEDYSYHDQYHTVKIALKNSLSLYLMEMKYSSNLYNSYLDDLLFETVNDLIELTMECNGDAFARAIIRKGLLTQNKALIFAGLKLINTPKSKERIKFIKDYNIFFITYKNLL